MNQPTLPADASEWLPWLDARIEQQLTIARDTAELIRTHAGADAALLAHWNDLQLALRNVLSICELVGESHPEAVVRERAELGSAHARSLATEIQQDRALYNAFAAIDASALDHDAARVLHHCLRDFKRAGVDQSDEVRAELKALQERQTELSQLFARNIREDTRTVYFEASQLDGLPADYVSGHAPDADGRIAITTDYPDYVPFMSFATNREARRKLYQTFLNRAWPQNDPVLLELLRLRERMAHLLGYPDWPSYEAEVKMIGSGPAVPIFIDRIAGAADASAKRDFDILADRVRADHPQADRIDGTDRTFYVEVLRRELYGVDAKEVRQYFDFVKVQQGLLDVTARLFGLEYTPLPDAPTWHEDVRAFDVHLDSELLGRIYLDLHPRSGKFNHAAAFEVVPGLRDRQTTEAALLCNFSRGLMEHRDVVTFFHEFGHLMHQILAGRHAWTSFSGISTEWDFVEAPSQLLEEWAWDPTVLQAFASNAEGQPIPTALVERMRRAEEFGKGFMARSQMFFAAVSYQFHATIPEDPTALVRSLQARYDLFDFVPDTHFHAAFGHLDGYGSGYYTYMWSLVIAKDLFTQFDPANLFEPTTAHRYRDTVLAPGGSADAAQLVSAFLGRPYSFDAFGAWLDER